MHKVSLIDNLGDDNLTNSIQYAQAIVKGFAGIWVVFHSRV